MYLQPSGSYEMVGALPEMSSAEKLLRMGATGAMAYHGYKRSGITGLILWSLGGSLVPVLAVPAAFAVGFAKKKGKR